MLCFFELRKADGIVSGGFISKSNCSSCVGNTAYSYSCTCQGVETPNIALSELGFLSFEQFGRIRN